MPGAEQWGWGCSHHHRAPAPRAPLLLHGNKCTAWDLEQLQVLVLVLAAQRLPWWAQGSVNAPPLPGEPLLPLLVNGSNGTGLQIE